MHQSQAANRQEILKLWGPFLWKLRSYLHQIGLNEAVTPSLVKNSGMEPYLHPFETYWCMGSKKQLLRLPTSPEIHLKKLISEGLEDIYEIKTCFRNQELTNRHEPEFLMLEWYRTNAGLEKVIEDLVGLVKVVSQSAELKVNRTSFDKIYAEKFQFQLTPQTNYEQIKAMAADHKINIDAAEDFDDVFNLILDEAIEPSLNPQEITIIEDYPPSQAALAKINERGFAARFEMYWKGLEIANAFDELTDAQEQRRRHEKDLMTRRAQGLPEVPMDEVFIKALEKGLPPTGGIALGLDRLFMAVYDIPSLEQARAFTIKDQIE